MAYPSGSGSEVLKRTLIHARSNTATAFRLGYSHDSHASTIFTGYIDGFRISRGIVRYGRYQLRTDGTNNHQLLQNQDLPAYTTYVWNDKFVLYGGDKLIVNLGSAGNVDFICSYIDQDWT